VTCHGDSRTSARRWMRDAGSLCVLLVMLGCSGELLTLGRQQSTRVEYAFGVPERLVDLDRNEENGNPTLTANGLEIFYTSKTDGEDADVWSAVRGSAGGAFDPPELIESVSSTSFDTSPAISADGLTLWLASERDGGQGMLDIWVSQRGRVGDAWPPPELVPALNSDKREIPRPPGAHGLIMPVNSDRDGSEAYWIYFARRANLDAEFGTPELVTSLADPDRTAADPFLTDDGLTLFFAGGPIQDDQKMDLYVCRRSSLDSDFGPPEPLSALNTGDDERDPWLSPDGTSLYFVSDREDDILDIYRVSVQSVTETVPSTDP
jgi:hypothetical protein